MTTDRAPASSRSPPSPPSSGRQVLVLLHGLGASPEIWCELTPALKRHYEVVALPLLGHRGSGAFRAATSVTINDLVDDAERQLLPVLETHGERRAHLVGYSLGGQLALELARRGRARTVCAFSPSGAGDRNSQMRAARKVAFAFRVARALRPLLLLVSSVPILRHCSLRLIARHGERVCRARFSRFVDDLLCCDVAQPLLRRLALGEDCFEALDVSTCQARITLAWSGEDALYPPGLDGHCARKQLPGADFRLLPRCGHVALFDDAALTLDTILEVCR